MPKYVLDLRKNNIKYLILFSNVNLELVHICSYKINVIIRNN